jgi:hypothetical protein
LDGDAGQRTGFGGLTDTHPFFDLNTRSETTTERNVSITNKTATKDTLNSRDSSAKDKQDRPKDLFKKSKGSDLKPKQQNVALKRAHTPTKSTHNKKWNENTNKHQNMTYLKQEKSKHKAMKEEHQRQHKVTKSVQVTTTSHTNLTIQPNKDAKENRKDNTKKTRRTTTSKSEGNYMARMINRAWKSIRRTTKEGKKVEDRRKEGAEQEATNVTSDNRDNEGDNEEWATKTEEPPTLEPSYEETGMYEQEEEREDHDNTEPPTQDTNTEIPGTSTDMETDDQEEKQAEDTPIHIPRSNNGIFVDALYKHLKKEPGEYELELYLTQDMEDMKQDDIEGALTDHHEDLQRVDNRSEANEGMTLTNWGHYGS